MTARVAVSKITPYVITGQDDVVSVSKLVAYIVLEPGTGVDTSNRQGHVHTQIIVRSS